jgi:hypothetical protein
MPRLVDVYKVTLAPLPGNHRVRTRAVYPVVAGGEREPLLIAPGEDAAELCVDHGAAFCLRLIESEGVPKGTLDHETGAVEPGGAAEDGPVTVEFQKTEVR